MINLINVKTKIQSRSIMEKESVVIACINTNRNFIGVEIETDYFNIAKDRIENYEYRRGR